MSDHTIEIELQSELGTEGIDDDPQNPIARGFERLFRTGKPPGLITQCYLIDLTGAFRWLGVFAHTPGGKIVFHPGLEGVYDTLLRYRKSPAGLQSDRKAFLIDHVTLEKDFQSLHFTSRQSGDHGAKDATYDLGGDRFLWFGLSIRDTASLRVLRKSTKVSFNSPARDSTRRVEAFSNSIKDRVFQALCVPTDKIYWPGFVHVSVIAGPAGFQDYNDDQLAFPIGSPFLKEPLQVPPQLSLRHHRLNIGAVDLQIVTAWLPGELTTDFSFSGGAN